MTNIHQNLIAGAWTKNDVSIENRNPSDIACNDKDRSSQSYRELQMQPPHKGTTLNVFASS